MEGCHLARPTISVVVPALNEAPTITDTISSLRETLPRGSEIIVVDDGSQDDTARNALRHGRAVRLLRSTGGLGVARARNWGAAEARGEVVAFSDAHVAVEAGTWQALVDGLIDRRVGGVAPRVIGFDTSGWGYGMSMTEPSMALDWLPKRGDESDVGHLCGCFTMFRRETFGAVGGFDGGMPCWGWEDAELSIRLWLLGYELRVIAAGGVAHLFRAASPYRVDPVWALHNQLRLAFAHFGVERLRTVLARLAEHPLFDAALERCLRSDILSRRATLFRLRKRDDDQYFQVARTLSVQTNHGGA